MTDLVPPHSANAGGLGRPTVLLADDDPAILKAISRTLANDFHVVATVTDGRQVLDAVLRFDPDLAVLDISMPGLNGLQTAEELKRSGARARSVFLTMHQDDEFVAKAISAGASGYVLKTLAWADLIPALRHALAGRQYLPLLSPLVMTNVDAHAVQFHGDDTSWLEGVANVLTRALRRGDAVATVLVETNRDVLALRMRERGWNLAELEAQGRYLVFDAEEAATRLMQGGRPDADSIAEFVGALERARTASAGGPRSHLTLVGEIAAVLCRHGNPEAAVELESLWDELTRSLPILTICAYPVRCADHHGTPAFLSTISNRHTVISRESGLQRL
jgi:DNA-binding NarL/FixJ family response regulator